MPTQTLPPWNIFEPPPVPVRRFTVDEYHRLGETGVLTDDDRVELLEGWIVPKVIHHPRHDATVDQAHGVLRPELPGGWRIRIQSAITTADSEPEPDLAVVRGPASRYATRHPTPEDIALVVEVADSSLDDDRTLKARLYARAGIAVYWLINVVDGSVAVYSDPSSSGPKPAFRSQRVYRPGEAVPLVIAEQETARISVQELLAAT